MKLKLKQLTPLFLLIVFSGCGSGLPKEVERSREQEKAGKFREAEAILLTAEKKHPKDARLPFHLGLLYERQFNELFKYRIKSITVNDPDFKPFGKAVRMRDRSGKELGYLIQDRTPVLEAFLRATRKDPRYEAAWLAAANLAAEMNRFKQAHSLLEQAATNLPASYKVPYYSGLLYKHKKRFADALKAFRRSLQRNPEYDEALYQTADLLLQTGDAAAAEKKLEKAFALDRDEKRPQQTFLRMLRYYFRKNQFKNAADWAVKHSEFLEDRPAAQRLAAISCFMAERDEPAGKFARAYLKAKPGNRVMLSILGKIALNNNDPEEAVKLLKQALKKKRTPQILFQIGVIYSERLQQPATGIRYLQEAVKMRPLHSKAQYALAAAAAKAGWSRSKQLQEWKKYLLITDKLKGTPLYSGEKKQIKEARQQLLNLQK